MLPYMNPDLNVARDLQNAGAAAVMPLAAPIGSNKGLATKAMIQVLIDEIDLPIINGRRNWKTIPGMQKPWKWSSSHHGEYSHCYSWKCTGDGSCILEACY